MSVTEGIFLYVHDLVLLIKCLAGSKLLVQVPDGVPLERINFLCSSFLQHGDAGAAHHFNHLLGSLINRVVVYIMVKPVDLFQLEYGPLYLIDVNQTTPDDIAFCWCAVELGILKFQHTGNH